MDLRARLVRCRDWFGGLEAQHRVFLSIQLVIALISLALWVRLPAPGWSVAILAFTAAAMSVHGEMRGWQKAIWMLLLGVLLVIELRSISADRAENQRKFNEAQKQQNADFAATTSRLETVIRGIQSTLQTANQTLQQTRPHSAIRFDRFEFPQASPAIQANTEYKINYFYVNSGTETASDVVIVAKSYIGKADNKEAQTKLAKRFEGDWKKLKNGRQAHSPSVLIPASPLFGTTKVTFTEQQIRNLSPNDTIYFFIRFGYSDETGRWRTDACSSLQRESTTKLDTNITHPCMVFENFRYQAPKKN